jgi:gamma-glutamylcyclotransferase (GGCT)/AIG2-like uncharacterized protein YtfP
MKMYNLFVYGTLLDKDFIMNDFLELYSLASYTATIKGKLFINGLVPFLVPTDDGIVQGRVYILEDERALKLLDSYEGYNELNEFNAYTREMRTVTGINFDTEAWVYVASPYLNTTKMELIEDGDYLRYRLDYIRKEIEKYRKANGEKYV